MRSLGLFTIFFLALVALVLLVVVSIDDRTEPAAERAAEPIVLSYGYGTRGVPATPFGAEGPVVISCEAYYEIV